MKAYVWKDDLAITIVVARDLLTATKRLEGEVGHQIDVHRLVTLDEDTSLKIHVEVLPGSPQAILTKSDIRTQVLWDHLTK